MTVAAVSVQEQQGWTVIAAGGLHLLVGWDADAPGLDRLREVAASGDLDEALDALAREGVRRAPDFVAVQDGSPARVVARGTAYAVVSGPGGVTELRAAGRGPWSDDDAPAGTTSIALHTGVAPEPQLELELEPEPEPEPEPRRPSEPSVTPEAGAGPAPISAVPSGWRLPSRLGRGREDAQQEQEAPAAAPATGAPAEVDELPSYDHLFGATQHGRPDPTAPHYIEAHDTDSIAEPGIGRAPIEAAGGFTPVGPQPADQTLPPPADTERGRPAAPDLVPQDGRSAFPARPAAAPARVAPPTPGGLIDSVPWRSGGSNVAPPEPATQQVPAQPRVQPVSAQPPGRPAGVHTPPPAPSLRPMGPPPPSPGQQAVPAPTPAPATIASPTTSSPTPPAAQPAAPPAAEPDVFDDDAEATVDRSALLAAAQAESGPLVLSVLCPAGHPSPPHAGTCRLCGRDIPVQQPFQTPRPPLGVLRLASGDVVSLDRGVLLGRSPKVNADLPAAERPHLVRVTSPENDISRNHVEVVLEGWHVLVRDLGSTNGTTVALPGQVPVRLRPQDQQVIEPGTIITMADEVSVTFEVGP